MSRRGTALLLIDVINAFSFEGAEPLLRAASRAAVRIERLAMRAREEGVPIVYVNDNFGKWRSDFASIIREFAQLPAMRGAITERLRPHRGDYFVLKPQHSGFYSTPLELLLDDLGVHTLVLTGFATDLCVTFTAHDAHMRGYRLVVPSDCTAANTPAIVRSSLEHVRTALHGRTPASAAVDFAALSRGHRRPRGQAFSQH